MQSALFSLVLFVLCSGVATGQTGAGRATGQTLYLPIYSHIWHGEMDKKGQPMKVLVSVSVSIRNTDPVHPITIVAVDYFDSAGKLLKNYLEGEVKLGAMASTRYVVKESDKSGGSGANFVVRWKSA